MVVKLTKLLFYIGLFQIIVGSGIEQKPVLIKIEYKIDPTKKMNLRVMKEWSRIEKEM